MKVFMLTVVLLVGAACASPQASRPPPPSGGPGGPPPDMPPPCFKGKMVACLCPSTVDAATCQAIKDSVKDATKVCFGTLLDAQVNANDTSCQKPTGTGPPPPPGFLPSPKLLVQCVANNASMTQFKTCAGQVWPAYSKA